MARPPFVIALLSSFYDCAAPIPVTRHAKVSEVAACVDLLNRDLDRLELVRMTNVTDNDLWVKLSEKAAELQHKVQNLIDQANVVLQGIDSRRSLEIDILPTPA